MYLKDKHYLKNNFLIVIKNVKVEVIIRNLTSTFNFI
jgi:hypothetical protein